MSRHRRDEHADGGSVWTARTALAVVGAGAALLAAGVLAGGPAAVTEVVTAVGAVAIFVATVGWITSTVELRYADRPLAQPPRPGPGLGTRRRRSLRRRSGIAYVAAAVGGVWALPWLFSRDVGDLLVMPIAVGSVVACFLAGPAARFVVTPRHLHIDTAFSRISVPRRLLGGFERSGLEIRLQLTDGDFFDLRVDSPIWGLGGDDAWRRNSRCQVRTAARLVALLEEVPAAPDPAGSVVHRLRPGMLAFAAVGVLATLVLLVLPLR